MFDLTLALVRSVNMEGEGFITYAAASHQGSRCFCFTLGQLSCHPSLYAVSDQDGKQRESVSLASHKSKKTQVSTPTKLFSKDGS